MGPTLVPPGGRRSDPGATFRRTLRMFAVVLVVGVLVWAGLITAVVVLLGR